MRKAFLSLTLLTLLMGSAQAEYLYKAMFVRAAPGKLLALIDLYKNQMPRYREMGDEPPLWMRHSQGDQWDLFFLFPMGSFEDYYAKSRNEKRKEGFAKARSSQQEFARSFYELVAWHEEVFVDGPPLNVVQSTMGEAGYFHVEMFHSLAGKQADLRRQREMENAYLAELGRPQNLIFTHEQGAAWDLFTVGCYRDLKHYAASADIGPEREDEAARKAGFESASQIGPYLRTLIASHHDTLATAIR